MPVAERREPESVGSVAGPREPDPLLSLTRGDVSRSLPRSLRRDHMSRSRLGSLRRGDISRSRSWSLMRGYLGGTLASFSRLGLFFRSDAMVSFLPPRTLAAMMRFIETLVILLTFPVCAPVGILPLEISPVIGVALIPRLPPWLIPIIGSFNIGGRIRVIRGPAVLGTEKVIQQSLYKPVTVVIDPRRIRPDPRLSVTIRRRGGIVIAVLRVLSLGRRRQCGDRALPPAKLPAPA